MASYLPPPGYGYFPPGAPPAAYGVPPAYGYGAPPAAYPGVPPGYCVAVRRARSPSSDDSDRSSDDQRDGSKASARKLRRGGRKRSGSFQRLVAQEQMQKTKICTFFQEGRCARGSSCTYAHGDSELKAPPDLQKTRICKAWTQGKCSDDQCTFAHGEHQLRSTNAIMDSKGGDEAKDRAALTNGAVPKDGAAPTDGDVPQDGAGPKEGAVSALTDGCAEGSALAVCPQDSAIAIADIPRAKRRRLRQRERKKQSSDAADNDSEAGSGDEVQGDGDRKGGRAQAPRPLVLSPVCAACFSTVATSVGMTSCAVCRYTFFIPAENV